MSQDLKSTLVFNTGPFLCSDPPTNAVYKNETDCPLYIRQIVVRLGMDKGVISDFGVKVKRHSDQSVLVFTNWDHYADPTNTHNLTANFEPNYFLLAPDDLLVLEFDGTVIPGSPVGGRGHAIVRILTTAQP